MDYDSYVRDVLEELEFVPGERQLAFIQHKTKGLNANDKPIVENAIFQAKAFGLKSIERPKTVVIMVHGIRTYGGWHYKLKHLLKDNNNVSALAVSFGFKDVLTFAIPVLFKQKSVDIVLRQIKNVLAENQGKKVVLVAHSFGTYITSEILKSNKEIVFDRVVFCGAIASESIPWDEYENVIEGSFVNDCGSEDIWPVMAKMINPRYGDSGVVGFQSYRAESRFHECGHDGFFTDEFIDQFWLPFICDGRMVDSEYTPNGPQKSWFSSVLTLVPGQVLYMLISLVMSMFLWMYFMD